LVLLLMGMGMCLGRCGTVLIATSNTARIHTPRCTGCNRLLLPTITIEVLEYGAGVKAAVVFILVPELQMKNVNADYDKSLLLIF